MSGSWRSFAPMGMLAAFGFSTNAHADGVPVPHEGAVHHVPGDPAFPGQHGATPKDGALPDVPMRLWVTAPSDGKPWVLRVDNTGDRPVRIAADSRLLTLDVTPPSGKKVTCRAPAPMRSKAFPDDRELILKPGHSYVEELDPRLYCFGSDAAALVPNATVQATLGWSVPAWATGKTKDPYIAAGLDYPATHAPLKVLKAPTFIIASDPNVAPIFHSSMVLPKPSDGEQVDESKAADAAKEGADGSGSDEPTQDVAYAKNPDDMETRKSSDDEEPEQEEEEVVDYNAPRLEVDASQYADGARADQVTIRITAKNDGRRPMLAALRPRMLSWVVQGPTLGEPHKPPKLVRCLRPPPKQATPREMYRTYDPEEFVAFNILISEACPKYAFKRPGLYRVRAMMYATEDGSDLGLAAYTGQAIAIHDTLVRVQSGPKPFYRYEPWSVPTSELAPGKPLPMPPKPAVDDDDDEEEGFNVAKSSSSGESGSAEAGGAEAAAPNPSDFSAAPSPSDFGAVPGGGGDFGGGDPGGGDFGGGDPGGGAPPPE